MRGNGGFWNRAGRASGGNRPVVIYPTKPKTEDEEAEESRQELMIGIRRGSPLALIAAYFVAPFDQEVRRTLERSGIRYNYSTKG